MVYVSAKMPTKGPAIPEAEATLAHWNSATQGWDIITTAVVSLTVGTNSYWISNTCQCHWLTSGPLTINQFAGIIDGTGAEVYSDTAPNANNVQVNFSEGYNYNINGDSLPTARSPAARTGVQSL